MRSGEMMVSKATAASLSWSASLLVVALVPVRPVAHALKDRPMMLTGVKIGLIVSCWPLMFLACLFTWPAFVAYYLSSGAEGSFKAEVRRAYATVVESLFGSPSSSSSSAMTLSS
ncbi:hypothetical protein DFJ73DRAFT_820573 [Zopfochytrium polystomum]|nr:hypothetical protein DFJ73DRAFT_820573 [Zopfochytrium polystomum]